MRNFRLLLYFLVGVFLSANAVLSFAVQTQNVLATRSRIINQSGQTVAASAVSCTGHGALTMGSNTSPGVGRPTMPSGDNGQYATGTYAYCYDGYTFSYVDVCPAETLSIAQLGGTWYCQVPYDPCSSKAGWYDNGGSPMSVNLPGSLPFYSGETGGKAEMPSTVCLNGCVADTTVDRGDSVATATWWGASMNPKYTGQSCASGSPKPGLSKPKDSEEKKCVDAGKGFGYVNDKVMCVTPDSKGGTAKKSSETKNADGTTTRTDTTTNISCTTDGACTTTTTTTTTVINADGSTASSKTETKTDKTTGTPSGNGPSGEGSSFCKDNPTASICKTGAFSGSCSQAPACEGDPIQCATAKAVFETNCKTLKPGEPPTTTEPVGEKKHNLSFEVSELSGGGVCPADRFIQINGKMVHFELGVICQFAIMLRPIIIALAWLIAGYIVFGWGNKRG